MNRDRTHFLLLNIGHFLDHLFMLIFATVAALTLVTEWNVSYGDLIKFATPGFFAFGLFALPAGWLADKWSREGMMVVFFIAIGAVSIATSFTETPSQLAIGLFVIGAFAAIYHPVGLAIVTSTWKNTGMRIAINGVWGNMGVACAALITGYFIDHGGWRLAFIAPGILSIGVGFAYLYLRWPEVLAGEAHTKKSVAAEVAPMAASYRRMLIRVSAIVFLTTAVGGITFQSTTFALPKIFDERLQDLAGQVAAWISAAGSLVDPDDIATTIGSFAFVVFAIASLAQVVVGSMLDRFGPRPVFIATASIQVIFFAAMPGLSGAWALAVALGFTLGAFGQIPINDFMIGKMASGAFRARIYGIRYVVSFCVLAATLPLIAVVYDTGGFDTLFLVLAGAAVVILGAVLSLPKQLPTPAATTT